MGAVAYLNRMFKIPRDPELPAWVFFLLRVGSFVLVMLVAWLVVTCDR